MSERDLTAVGTPPRSRAVGDSHQSFRPSPLPPCPLCTPALLGKQGVLWPAVADFFVVNCVSDEEKTFFCA